MPFKSIGLADPLVQGILATGYTAPTEIQLKAIPAAIRGQDIIGCAQTGTGKTAAFVLPILNRLCHEKTHKKRRIKSLIVTPTRELALQIEQCISEYGRFLSLRTVTLYGGVSITQQLDALARGVDIIVATPGRLLDHIQRDSVDLNSLEVLVLDEADRMLDMGFIKDVRRIIRTLPKKRQTLLFSATMSSEVKGLASSILKSPKVIQIGKQENPLDTIEQSLIYVEKEQKMALLLHLLETTHMFSVLIFSRTKYGADKIKRKLTRANISSVAIHSNRTQKQRQSALEGFRAAKFQVLVATDIAARGIDVEGITHVINYDVPNLPEDYIHRIGRTGRATATGDAITLVSTEEKKAIQMIEKFIGCKIRPRRIEGFTPVPGTPPVGHASGGRGASQSIHPLAKKSKRRNTSSAPRRPGRKASPTRRRGPSAKRSRS